MKILKHLSVLLFAAVAFSGCKKQAYVSNFDELPQERIAAQIELVKTTLTGAENGWIATLATGLGGGYGFYMDFEENQMVKMYADLTDNTSTVLQESQYRVKQDMGTALTFDTYNYISVLNNPESGAFGGQIREGFRSDIDFIYQRSTADSIIFVGKRYRQPFILVKATAEQKAKYLNAAYKTFIDQVKQFFVTNPNSYFDLGNLKVSVEANSSNNLAAGKRMTLSAIYPNDSIAAVTGKYAFTVDKLSVLDSGIAFNNTVFTRAALKDPTTLALYDNTGKEYVLKNNTTPLLPLYKLWGTKYSGMLSDFKQIYPGTSTKGAEILNFFHLNMENAFTGYRFNYGRINLMWNVVNRRISFNGFSSQNGGASGWTTTSVYNYTVDASGIYTFTLNSSFTGGYVSKAMQKLHEFLLNNRVQFDYYVDGTTVYAKMASADDPTIVMTFVLIQ